MRHNRRTKRFGRSDAERRAMLENIVSSLLVHQEIKTTLPKAKEAKRLADRVITLGKEGSLSSKRQVFSYLQDHALTSKIFKEVAPRFKNRSGGYTRILQLGRRKGDGATLALLELTEKEIKIKEAPKAKEKKDVKTKDSAAPSAPAHELKREETQRTQKSQEVKKEKPKTGFFRNLSRFFRNKGGG